MEEAIQVSEELGLSNAGDDQPDIDELLARLQEIRFDWDWKEEINPHALSNGTPLTDLSQQGIFNRAILIAAERSPYTKGLESELGSLQSVEESNYHETALGSWLNGQSIESLPVDERPLIEVLPLNSEQRQAVRQAAANPLTVITGPPGTGKSQVVTSILVNAAWQNKTVLFASKNNKAVDVVETRVNALGPRPVLLRLGANEYQSRLAEYLVSLLAATTTANDRERYHEHETIHTQLQKRSADIDDGIKSLITLRNDVDRAEQRVEQIRGEVGEELFRSFRALHAEALQKESQKLQSAIDQANIEKQSFVIKIAWFFVRKRRFVKVREAARAFQNTALQIGLMNPEAVPDTSSITQWIDYGIRLASQISKVVDAKEYFRKLDALTEARSLEELSKQRKVMIDDLAANSETLWRLWLRLQPSRLGPEQRKLLGDYSALLQMIVSSNAQNQQLERGVFRRYYQLFPKITSILPCWAVASLSARGRVPFEANFFDLLVIDEASQCDIASALPLLYRARRVVIIGDPMQLRHISTLSRQQDQQLLSKHDLVNDYPGWAYSPRSLFDLASSLCRSEDIVALRDHHRSHADIIEFSNEEFYEGRLRVATSYARLRRPSPDEPAVRWIDVKGKTVRPGNGGAVNESEAHAVVKEIERLVIQGYRGNIGVVSPFRSQANRIRDLVNAHDVLSARIADLDFLADTVHKFQGDERDVMIFSPVVSSGVSDGAIRFLQGNPNLFNVAITRARAALIVVGDRSVALSCNVDYLARFAVYAGKTGINQQPVCRSAVDDDYGPEYPPVSHPERVSEWEHRFYRSLYHAGIRSVPQYAVEKYILDFEVLDGNRRLNIEIDGEHYHRNWDGELSRRDQIRTQRLIELGWDVIRFWVYQVRDDLDQCIERVHKWLGH
jgi:very-short-patch-repair endonuclease